MKTIMMITLLLVLNLTLRGQEKITITPKGTLSETVLVIRNFNSDISIKGISGNEIVITAENYEGKPEKANGLRSLTSEGVENTGIGLNTEMRGNDIIISAASREASNSEYTFQVPKSVKIKVMGDGFNPNDLTISGMASEIEAVTQSGDISIQDVTGPIVAKTINGDISISFSTLNQQLPTSLNSINGDIDITVKALEKGNFIMSSISGEIFTDLDFKVEKKEVSNVSNSKVKIKNKNTDYIPTPPSPPNVDVDIDIDTDVHHEHARAMKAEAEIMREQAQVMHEQAQIMREKGAMTYAFNQDFNFNFVGGVGSRIKASLNGGGVDFSINTISGDIFIRKAK